MKKLVAIAIVVVFLLVSFSVALAAPYGNPHGVWIYDVECDGFEPFDVWVHNYHSASSFDEFGGVGVTKAIYLEGAAGEWVLAWMVPGNGIFKNTTWCEWYMEGMHFRGEILTH